MKSLIVRKLEGKEFLGHPVGLLVLFLTEMWERFSYYGMRTLLVLYMTNYLLLDPARASEVFGYNQLQSILEIIFGTLNVQQMSSQIYGLYTAFVYLTPVFGGILADRFLGQHKCVYLGAILMAIGHFLMAGEQFFLLAMFFLVLGNGAFKPNISTQVGNLYKPGDKRRDSAFTIFYMGVNLGALLSPFICGTLGQVVGWHWGFGAAGVGMVVGLIIYWLGSDLVPKQEFVRVKKISNAEMPAVKQRMTLDEVKAVVALGVLCFLNIVFWGIYEQQGNTLQLWADERTNWNLLGFQIPSTWFQSMNPFMIIVLAPVFNLIWKWQAKRGTEPSSVVKMGIGCIICGSAYILMILAAQIVPEGERGSVFWLVSTILFFTIGELYLSPVGLSLVTKVAPARMVSMMMGIWFLSSFFGNYMAGYIGTYYSIMAKDQFFTLLTAMGLVTGLAFFMFKRPLVRITGNT